jgi:uncharacterized protein (TIGR04255 family)
MPPFPDSPRVVFDRNPITEVICQLRFPTILEIGASLPANFQNRIRSEYPLFEREEAAGVPPEIAEMLRAQAGAGSLDNLVSPVNKFSTVDKKRTVALARDFVAVSERQYVEWAVFWQQMELAKQALEEVYTPVFYERVGLRYVNVLDLKKLELNGSEWRDLLNKVFVGMVDSAEVAPNVVSAGTQVSINLNGIVPGATATVRYAPQRKQQKFIFDSDFFVGGRVGVGNVRQILDHFNRLNGNLFRWLVPKDGPLWRALRPRAVAT